MREDFEEQIRDLNETIQEMRVRQLTYEEELNEKAFLEQNTA